MKKTTKKAARRAPRTAHLTAEAREILALSEMEARMLAEAEAPATTRMAPLRETTLKLNSFTIRREGAVEWRVAGDSHCGPKSELKTTPEGFQVIPVRYTAVVTCAPQLDSRGFLFDQAALDLFMRRLASRETTLSCEALSHYVATAILDKIAREVPTCRVMGLTLTLSPAPFAASITASYGAN